MGARERRLSAGEIADILGVDAAWVTARIDGGELRATHHHGSHPSRPMPERHRISGRDLQVFLMGHAHELDADAVDLTGFIGIMAVQNPGRRKSRIAAKGQRGRTRGQLPTDAGPERKESGCGPWWRPAPPTRRRPCWGGTSTRCASRLLGSAWNGASTRTRFPCGSWRASSAWTSAGSCAASTGKPSVRSLPTDAAPVCGRLAYTGCRPRR